MKRSLQWMDAGGPLRDEAGSEGADGGGGGGSFQLSPEALKAITGAVTAAVMPEINKALNGYDKKFEKRLEGIKTKPDDPPKDDEPPKDGDGKPDLKTQHLEKKIAEMAKEREQEKADAAQKEARAKEKSRQADLTKVLTELGVPKERLESAIRAIGPDVQFDEEGKGENLIGVDGSSLSDYAKAWIGLNEHFLPPKIAGGAGATPGSSTGVKSVDISSIKPGMKDEDYNAAWQEVGRTLGQQ